MKRTSVLTHTIRQTQIPVLQDVCVTNTTSVKMRPHKNCFSFYIRKNTTCLSGGLLRIGQVFSVSCKIMYQWVMTNCLYMQDIFCWIIDYCTLVISNGQNWRDTPKYRLAFRTVSRAGQFSVTSPTLNRVPQTVSVMKLGIGNRIVFFVNIANAIRGGTQRRKGLKCYGTKEIEADVRED